MTHDPSRGVTVKDIPVSGKATLFAGRRRNGGLGGHGARGGYLPAAVAESTTADVRRTPRRGTPSACATKRTHPAQAREIVACAKGTASFARSFDPCTSILTMLRGASFGGGAFEEASRSGKPAQAGGTGTGVSADGRSAARRVSPLSPPERVERQRGTMKKREEIEVSAPARNESPGLVARTS